MIFKKEELDLIEKRYLSIRLLLKLFAFGEKLCYDIRSNTSSKIRTYFYVIQRGDKNDQFCKPDNDPIIPFVL